MDSLFLFTARPLDADTGFQNNLNRWYDPAMGRWLSEDPVGCSGGPNLYAYVGNKPTSWVDPKGTVPISCECYDHWYNWSTTSVQTDCGGLAATCCTSACGEFYAWSGRWDIVGALPSDEPNAWGEAWERVKCVQRCVNQSEGQLIAALTGLGTVGGYTYAFSTVPRPPGTDSLSPQVSRISVWVSRARDCCPSVAPVLAEERKAAQALRKALKLKLPPGLANSLSVTLRAGMRACEFIAIVEAAIYAWCSSQCMEGQRF
ncbi:hypothetical protein JCM19992_21300 [Thermostilla marina]